MQRTEAVWSFVLRIFYLNDDAGKICCTGTIYCPFLTDAIPHTVANFKNLIQNLHNYGKMGMTHTAEQIDPLGRIRKAEKIENWKPKK